MVEGVNNDPNLTPDRNKHDIFCLAQIILHLAGTVNAQKRNTFHNFFCIIGIFITWRLSLQILSGLTIGLGIM